jgi:tetratricopeptide (TPR) repeat protein
MVLELLDRIWVTWRKSASVGVHRRLAIRRAIAAVQPKASRRVLDELLHLAAPGTAPQPDAVAALLRYAARLQYESEFRLASHVYSVVIDYAIHIGYVDIVPEAYEHQGTCMRERGDARAALASYAVGLSIAARHRDKRARVSIAIAQSSLLRARGKPAEARTALEPVLRLPRKVAAAEPELFMRALHERGSVSHALGDHSEALYYFALAFRLSAEPTRRGRLLNDIALSLKAIGLLPEAREAWLVSYLTTKGDSVARWDAGVRLLALARLRRDARGFDQYRAELERASMPARLLVAYWREVGDGSMLFGREREAVEAYQRAATHAARYGYRRQWEELKRALEGHPPAPEPPAPAQPPPLPAAAEELLQKISALRSLPGLLGRGWRGDGHDAPTPPLRTALKRGRRPRSLVE